MLRSMYAGISGMRGFQTKLDVIGNNIANVNTSGFKKGRVTFQDMMSQTERGAQGADAGRGGINPMQVGLGSQKGSIDTIHTQGFMQSTGRELDVAIQGEGFFVVGEVSNGETQVDDEAQYYTRAGNFYLDDQGYLVNSDGYYLLGYGVETTTTPGEDEEEITKTEITDVENNKIKIPEGFQSFSISKNGDVNYVDKNGNPQIAGRIQLATFSNSEGLEKLGGNLYLNTNNSGDPVIVNPGKDGSGDLMASSLEMSNVDLAEEFTEMIVAQRGFQANTRIITTSDEILQELVNLKR